MPTFTSPDHVLLSYREIGTGDPLICVPGGPMADAWYFGELGGLAAHRRLILLDPRGTGASAEPADPASYRCDRQVGDLEALRDHLGLEQVDLLAHSAGVNLAVLSVTAYPERVGKLVLVGPSTFAVGMPASGAERLAVARSRAGEPEYAPAVAALERIVGGEPSPEAFAALDPLFHGSWDAETREYAAEMERRRNGEAARIFGSEGAYSPDRARSALSELTGQVLVLTGEYDVNSPPEVVRRFAELFPRHEYVVQAGAGHFPWRDDPAAFTKTVAAFLGQPSRGRY